MQTRIFKSVQCGATVKLLLTLTLLNIHHAAGRPDVRQSPFSLELQPPLLEPAADDAFKPGGERAVDSYGNPIDALRPIDTPDGRKVVSAQGLQFEIPNYASGITEIRKPADDLLPPHIDAIAVALPTSDIDSTDSTSFAPAPAISLTPPKHESSTTSTDVAVEVEQAQLIPLPQQQQQEESAQSPQLISGTLPDYLLELQQQDPNIGGPVPWTPAPNAAPLSVIAWDLLPPLETAPSSPTEPEIITEQRPTKHVQGVEQEGSHNIRVSLSSSQGLSPLAPAPLSSGQVSVVPLERDGPDAHGTNAHVGSTTPRNSGRFPSRHRGTVHFSTSTTQRPRSSTTLITTTTTTSTPRTTTTQTTPPTSTTTTSTTSTTTTTPSPRTTTPLDPSSLYKLENEEAYAYTLPPWLQEVTDPDLDVAVTFIVPTDNDQYNHTLTEDLEPPFEPFVDLHNIQLTPPPVTDSASTRSPLFISSTTARSTSTTTTTTTRRPSTIASPPVTTKYVTKSPIFQAHNTQQQKQQPQQKPQLITTTTHTAPPKTFDVKTTTTRTTAAEPLDPNPFDSSTLPPWLQDFDYPDVGPGVPYNPDNFKESPVANSQQSGGSKPNDFQPHGFATSTRSQFQTTTKIITTSTSAPAVTASSAFPSKVTLPLPAISSSSHSPSNTNDVHELNTVEPPLVLIPPVVNTDESSAPSSSTGGSSSHLQPAFTTAPNPNPTTNSITNFAARFDGPSSGEEAGTPKQPLQPLNEEQFPPFTGNGADNQKVEYTKSDEGKVISTPVNTLRKDTQDNSVFQASSAAPPPVTNTGKYTGGFGAPAGLLRPQNAGKPDIYVAGNQHDFSHNVKANRVRPGAAASNGNPGRYTGGFGAPSGVLSPQNAPRPFQQSQEPQQVQQSGTQAQLANAASSHHQTRFGGPPGILVPFDNVQHTGEQ